MAVCIDQGKVIKTGVLRVVQMGNWNQVMRLDAAVSEVAIDQMEVRFTTRNDQVFRKSPLVDSKLIDSVKKKMNTGFVFWNISDDMGQSVLRVWRDV